MFRTAALLALVLSLVGASVTAHADSNVDAPPAAFSTHSARTLDEDRTAVFAGLGWSGLYVGGYLSPADAFDIGFRGQLLMGSPIMGLALALGGEASVPMRVRLLRRMTNDVALTLSPRVVLGRGQLVGIEGPLREDFGYSVGLTGGVRVSHYLLQKLTLLWGIEGSFDYANGKNFSSGKPLGSVYAVLGLESLVTRASLVFIEAQCGYGFAPDSFFDTHLALRAVVGFAHTTFR